MRAVAVAVMVGVTGCGALPNDKICTPIHDVESVAEGLPSAVELEARRTDLAWQRQRAEACLHRAAYNLAKAEADVGEVADAAIQRCQPAVGQTASLAGHTEAAMVREADEIPLARRQTWIDQTNVEVSRLRNLAASWVVEGRAGNCRG